MGRVPIRKDQIFSEALAKWRTVKVGEEFLGQDGRNIARGSKRKQNRKRKSAVSVSQVHVNSPPRPARPTVSKEWTQPLKSSAGNRNSGLVCSQLEYIEPEIQHLQVHV